MSNLNDLVKITFHWARCNVKLGTLGEHITLI